MHADDVVAAVLARPSYGGRARSLRGRRGAFDVALVDRFLERAEAILRSEPATARQLARLALYVARRLHDAAPLVRCLRMLCQAGLLGGHYPEALRAVDEAVSMLDAEAHGEVAELRSLRVQVLTQLERFDEARRTGEEVLRTFEALDRWQGVVRARMALADVEIQVARPREALRHYAAVQRMLPETVKPRFRAALAANRANALQACNRFRAAARWFEQARDVFEAEACGHTVAQMDYNLAYSHVLRGNYGEALRRYEDVADAFERLADDMHLAHVDLDRAEVHLLMSLPAEARADAQRAARRFETLGLHRDVAQAELFAGRAAAMLGDLDGAMALYAAARGRFEAAGLVPRVIHCVVQEAYAAQRLGRSGTAQLLAEGAATLLHAGSDALTVASVHLLRANLHLAAGRLERAHARAVAAMERSRHVYAPWLHVEALRVAGTASRRLGREEEAVLAFEEAVGLLERHRGGVPPDEYMSAFLSARSDLYGQLVDLLVQRGDVEAAFDVCERAKSRSLLDRLARGHAVPEELGETPRIRFLRESLSAVYWHLFRAGGDADPAAAHDAAARHREASELEAELSRLLRARSLRRDTRLNPDLVAVPRLAEVQAALEPASALLDYMLCDDALIVFVVKREGVQAFRREIGPEAIERRLLRYRFHLAKHERVEVLAEDLVLQATRENLRGLRRDVLDPALVALDVRRLVIAPHGALHTVPFHALPRGAGWLTDAYEIVTAPSAGVYLQCREAGPRGRGAAAVFGVPDEIAPEIATECAALGRILRTPRVHVGDAATFASFRTAAASARILHVATHGMFRPDHPTMSAIRLADRWVTLHDLADIAIASELVVLSTCESGTAGVAGGGDVLGLSRGVLAAGVPTLLCTQWRVRDGVTAEFMAAFHSAVRGGRDVAVAHRLAMAAIRRRHPHPYYWAPFFLLGCPSPATVDSGPGAPAGRLVPSLEGNA